MSYILYINGNLIELSEASPIAQTKQVNDIISLENRQTNFTNKFTVKPTANNVRAMGKLYLTGNQSNIPYQKNTADLFDAVTGLCMIYKGWANISGSSDKGYEIYVYDGNLEIYKAIENKTLADLDLTDLAHSKTLADVVATFDNSKPYKYILADYNGKSLYDTNKINIDYLVPSVRASWLISKIETYTGFNFNGSFKTNPDYLNLWMTYPKGTPSNLGTTEIYDNTTGLVAGLGLTLEVGVGFTATKNMTLAYDIKTATSGSYSVTVNSVIISGNLNVGIGDLISSVYVSDSDPTPSDSGEQGFLKIYKFNSLIIDFLDELKGMTMREFFNEIIWRFGLTQFKSKYENVYDFKTLAEITNPANAIDWTSKFISKESEKYIFGSYAQNNFMRYKYNDDNASYNDGFLVIDNKNLDDSKTIIQSKAFSPELSFSNNLGFITKVYKLWDKEPKDDGTITYKPLANRFYFMRSMEKTFDAAVTIGSPSLFTSQTITVAPVESFTGLTFNEIISKYYPDIKKILNKAQVIPCKLFLKNKDVNDVDFSVPYYFEQLGGSFILNKISNFIPGKETAVKLIRINNL